MTAWHIYWLTISGNVYGEKQTSPNPVKSRTEPLKLSCALVTVCDELYMATASFKEGKYTAKLNGGFCEQLHPWLLHNESDPLQMSH